jgi:hypothetical protein
MAWTNLFALLGMSFHFCTVNILSAALHKWLTPNGKLQLKAFKVRRPG